jgi:general secretion pathway protein G
MKNFSEKNGTGIHLLSRKRGFTLVEILIVLALIGIVAGLAMSNLGEIFGGGKEKAARIWVESTGPAYLESYNAINGNYPAVLTELFTPAGGGPKFVKKASDLNDPWGKPYQYTNPGPNYELFTMSPSGQKISNLGKQ